MSRLRWPSGIAARRRRWDRLNWISTALALGIATLVLIFSETDSLRDDFLHRLATQARLVATNSAAAVVFHDARAARENLSAFRHSPEILSARILTLDGQLFASYMKAGSGNHTHWWELWEHFLGLEHLVYHTPLELEGVSVGQIELVADMEPLRERLFRFIGVLLGAGLFALLLAQVLMFRLRGAVRRAEDDMVYLAHYDALTGLPNRAYFETNTEKRLAAAARSRSPAALLFFDLDNFKVVNDSLGHPVGDELLRQVAIQLSQVVRQTDSLARLGGDEFTLLVLGAGRQQAGVVAEHVMQALHRPFRLEGHELSIGASIGIALFPEDGDNTEQLLRSADSALYAAKAAGKHTWRFFSAEMDQLARDRLSLEAGLRRALERNELRMVYQPIVDIRQGRRVGYEALMRWHSPELGEVPPTTFIAVAEETGLIQTLGAFALSEACAQLRRWHDAGDEKIFVSVNVSARQFYGHGLVGHVQQALSDANVDATFLELEITETALMGMEREVLQILGELDHLGVSLSLDDFGVGYASLAQLKRLPISKLKIDREFVRDIPQDGDDAAIITAIIAMAGALGMEVLAEGIETEEQRQFLDALDCQTGQGYLFGRPQEAA